MIRELVISGFIIFFIVPSGFLTRNFLSNDLNQTSKNNPIYICFEQDAGLVEIEQLTGSSITTFKIPRKGYETVEQRRRAFARRGDEEKLVPFNALFLFEFYATMYPEEENLAYLQDVHCRTPEEFREGDIDPENNSHFIFIQMISDEHILVWKNVKRRIRI